MEYTVQMDSFFKFSSLAQKSKVLIDNVGMLRLIRKGAPKKLKEKLKKGEVIALAF
jgi:hypothetical protein